MNPLFATKPVVVDAPVGFQEIPQSNQPTYSVAVPERASVVAYPKLPITDADIDNLGAKNASRAAETSKKILANVRASDTEGFGIKLNELVASAKKLDPKKMGEPSLLGKIFGAPKNLKAKLMAEYASVETQMNALIKEIDVMANLMSSRVDDLEAMFEENFQTHQLLEQDVATGMQMVAQLEQHIASLGTPKSAFEAQTIADLQSRVERLRKRCDDFERGMQLAKLAAPEIRMQQTHNRALVNTVRDIKVTTLPAWQGVFSRYVIALEAKKGVEIVNSVYDATDEAFRMQADQLRENTVTITTAQQRSVVSIETLEHMQTQLLGAVDDALRIAKEGRAARDAAKPKLKQLEQGLIERFSVPQLSN